MLLHQKCAETMLQIQKKQQKVLDSKNYVSKLSVPSEF